MFRERLPSAPSSGARGARSDDADNGATSADAPLFGAICDFARSMEPHSAKFAMCREPRRAIGTRGVQSRSACDMLGIPRRIDRWQREFALASKSLDARLQHGHDTGDDRVRES